VSRRSALSVGRCLGGPAATRASRSWTGGVGAGHGIPPLTWLDGDRGAPGPPGARRPGRRRSDPAV